MKQNLNKSTCLFLGAGFSRALFEIPTQAGFVKYFLEWEANQNGHSNFSEELKKLLRVTDDLELVLSHYFYLAFSAKDKGKIRELMFLRVAIAKYLSTFIKEKQVSYYSSVIMKFLESRGIDPLDLFIVTTNYDLGAERLIEKMVGSENYNYPGINSASGTAGIPIHKLHGSINWVENRGASYKSGFTRRKEHIEISEPSSMTVAPSPWDNFGYYYESDGLKYTPVLIPFFFQKESLMKSNDQWKRLFDKVWRSAFDLMKASDKFFFWGYGLPTADYQMFSHLYSVLNREGVVGEIVDCQKDTNLMKLGELFPSSKIEKTNKTLEKYL